MIGKLARDIAEFFEDTGRLGGKIRTDGATQPSPAVVHRRQEVSRSPMTDGHALILADRFLNRLLGYARKGSRTRNDFYQRDLNWIRDVLLRVEAGERNPLRPTGE
jgi:hypothetical protein